MQDEINSQLFILILKKNLNDRNKKLLVSLQIHIALS